MLEWTRKKPTVPGWYWHRWDPRDEPNVCQIVRDLETGALMITWETLEAEPVDRHDGAEWAGPLELPRYASLPNQLVRSVQFSRSDVGASNSLGTPAVTLLCGVLSFGYSGPRVAGPSLHRRQIWLTT